MRAGQNKRMRGRNNNRRGPNPLTRSYESNGPDVKIRGTAAHVAEKYVQLARDAHSSGDPVAAESYLQHAEHYLRLIAAAQAQQFAAQQAAMSGGRVEDAEEFEGDDEFESSVMDRYTFRAPQAPQAPGFEGGEQPRADFPPREPYQPREGGHQGHQGQQREGREGREGGRDFRRDRNDRNDRGERHDRNDRGDFRRERFDRNQPRPDRAAQPQPETPETEGGLPSFITAPVRTVADAGPGSGEQPEIGGEAVMTGEGEEGRFPLRPRRRRRRGPRDFAGEGGEFGGDEGGSDAPAPAPAAAVAGGGDDRS